jgi:hypothetical protein
MARLLLALLILPLTAAAADDSRVTFLEQEVRNLQRQVQALSRQVDELRTRPDRPGPQSSGLSGVTPVGGAPRWVDVSLWRRVRPGMSELEVISALGPPTTMREESGTRVLLYAMEIGDSGFLRGSVKLRERAVVEILQPTLE